MDTAVERSMDDLMSTFWFRESYVRSDQVR